MKRFTIVTTIVATLAAVPATAGPLDFYADPRLPVNRVSAQTFEVVERRGAGPRDVWCAAARYAVVDLGQTRGRLYVAKGRGAASTVSGAKGVLFSTAPPSDTGAGRVSTSIRKAGTNLLVNHALQFCRDYIIEPLDQFP